MPAEDGPPLLVLAGSKNPPQSATELRTRSICEGLEKENYGFLLIEAGFDEELRRTKGAVEASATKESDMWKLPLGLETQIALRNRN